MAEQSPDDLMGITEAARVLGISSDTLRDWSRDKRLTTYRTAGGHRRFRRADLIALRDAGRQDVAPASTDAA
jgi:excisionase family DNA binding protein